MTLNTTHTHVVSNLTFLSSVLFVFVAQRESDKATEYVSNEYLIHRSVFAQSFSRP